jgi:hypothetical protein
MHVVLSAAAALSLYAFGVAAQPTFTEVSQQAGITYYQRHPESRFSQMAGNGITGGAAVGDYDGDGWDDLYVTVLTGQDVLYRNLGDGTFRNATASSGIIFEVPTNGAAWGDLDNDGDLDLYVTSFDLFRNFLFLNNGDGTFREAAVERGAAVVTDLEHRGSGVGFGDYNRDGWIDILTTEWVWGRELTESHSRLLRNRGSAQPGYFGDVTDEAGVWPMIKNRRFSPAFVDLDMDGWADLPLASDFSSTELWWNEGDETFSWGFTEEAGLTQGTTDMGSTFGDYDGDGDLDWFITAANNNRMFRNDGGRLFTEVTDELGIRHGDWGWGTALFDYDNDGDLDIALTNGYSHGHEDRNFFWRNDGPGKAMTEIATEIGFGEETEGRGLLVFDYDRDGDLDIFTANNKGKASLYRNEDDGANHWLRIRFSGRHNNTEGLGVKIWVEEPTTGRRQYREMGVSTHFLGQSERVAHFGLGSAPGNTVQVTLKTPLGFTHTLDHVEVDTTLILDASDFDSDGVANRLDGEEDTDRDGVANYLDMDSDNDGAWDGVEVAYNGDPLDPSVFPELPNVTGDLNYDEVANAMDIQLAINRVLGVDTGYRADLNEDGKENASDVQIVINSVLSKQQFMPSR